LELLSTVSGGFARTVADGLADGDTEAGVEAGVEAGALDGGGDVRGGWVVLATGPGERTTAGESFSAGTSAWRARMPPATSATATTPPSAARSAGTTSGGRAWEPFRA
jgi:hypothetical protein